MYGSCTLSFISSISSVSRISSIPSTASRYNISLCCSHTIQSLRDLRSQDNPLGSRLSTIRQVTISVKNLRSATKRTTLTFLLPISLLLFWPNYPILARKVGQFYRLLRSKFVAWWLSITWATTVCSQMSIGKIS